MARIIDFGPSHGNVSFPDDATDEQIAASYRATLAVPAAQLKEPSVGDYERNITGSLIRGGANVLASLPESFGILNRAIKPYGITAPLSGAASAIGMLAPSEWPTKIGQAVRDVGDWIAPAPVPELKDSFWATKVPEGVGSAAAFMAGGLGGRLAKIPTWLGAAGLGSSAGSVDFYQDAKAHGADEGTAQIASLVGRVVGTSEALPLAKIINRLDKVSGHSLSKFLITSAKDTLEEALQEGGQRLAQNITAQQLYDQDRDLFQDLQQSTGVGGVTGLLVSTLTQALGIPIGRSRMRRGEERRRQVIHEGVERGELLPEGAPSATSPQIKIEPQVTLETETTRAPLNLNLSSIVTDITSKWQNAPAFQVVGTATELPEDVKADAQRSGIDINRVPAATDRSGKVWLVGSNITNDEHARRLILHESVGHLGVRGIIQDPVAFEQFMRGVAQRHADTSIGREVRTIYGNDEILVGEEVIAKLAENPEADPSLWQQIVAAVRGVVRSIFNLEVSENDIKVLLSKARKTVQSGSGRTVSFGVGTKEGARFNAEPSDRIPIHIQSQDGTLRDAEFAGYYDLTAMGRGGVPSVGWVLPNGQKTHGMLASGETIIGTIPTFEEWSAKQGGGETRFAVNPADPQVFKERQKVEAAKSNPGLSADKQQEIEDLAAVQAHMMTDGMRGFLMQTPRDKVETMAQGLLDYLHGRMYLSQTPQPLSTLPDGTDEEKRAKEVAGAAQMAHYGLDRTEEREFGSNLEVYKPQMEKAVEKLGKATRESMKSDFLTAMFNNLTSSFRTYLVDLSATQPATENLQARWRERLNRGQERLNDFTQSPIALKRALSAIAISVPANLLTENATNQQVIDWVMQQGTLYNVVGQDVRDWLLSDDGTGQPALINYAQLIPDLATLNAVLTRQQEVANDIRAFEQWFSDAGNETKVSAKAYAEKYFKFRTGRDRALSIAAAINKEIGDLDTKIRANSMARDKLQAMMSSPGYVTAVREAAAKADIVVRALYDSQDKRTGIVDRDRSVGKWSLKSPYGETVYVVDLYPTAAQEFKNRENLSAWMWEARQWAMDNSDKDPLLADEYNAMAEYIERHFMHPALDPRSGFTRLPRVRIPFTSIRFSADPFDWITSGTGSIGYSIHTIRDVIERIGGRAMRQAFTDATVLDTVMRKVEAINSNPEYGFAAQTQADLKAIASHGWSHEQAALWEETVIEPVLAAAQNRMSPSYDVGDVVVGSGVKLTSADVAAMKLMKQWGDAIIAAAPNHIMDRLGDLGITRKAIGNGRFTGHRIAAPWTKEFVKAWNSKTEAEKIALLKAQGTEDFRRVVLGYLAEYNPEFGRMNPASPNKSPLFTLYRRLANMEKAGLQRFNSWDEVVDYLANEAVSDGLYPTYADAAAKVQDTLFAEITGFIKSFESNVLGYDSKEVWGGVPKELVTAISANNSFTMPRGQLQAPSTFYTYSTASEGRRLQHVGSLRSLLNLKLMQSGREAMAALETKKREMEDRVNKLTASGMKLVKAREKVFKETERERELGNARYDYREILVALNAIEHAFVKNLERYEKSTSDYYEHAGVAAYNNAFGTIKSSLLSSTQAISTNFWSGSLFGPAILHWQTGQFFRAITDVLPAPHMWKTVMRRVASMVEGNKPLMSVLNQNLPMFTWMSKMVIEASKDWERMQKIAHQSGMVNPYNLGMVLDNKKALKRSGGRLTTDTDPHQMAELINMVFSAPGPAHVTETLKAYAPRVFDNMINYVMLTAWEGEVEFLKKMGWVAFKARETMALANGKDWQDLSNPDNVLKPTDLGLRSRKGLERYQQLFVPLGSLDFVLMDFYERTKNMTPAQRAEVPLLNDDDYASLAIQYAAISNVSTETNRPFSLKGKGSDGVWRNIVGTFMGWSINMTKQFSKVLQTHSGDKGYEQWAGNMLAVATLVVLLSAVGAWNWEFGDELTKLLYGQSSARIQLGNIKDVITGFKYLVQTWTNVVPILGSSIGGLFGIAYTGRGTPFDMASLSPHIGLVADVYGSVKRIIQTGDAVLPLTDFVERWIPMSKIVTNRLPLQRGLLDQQNAIRSLNASAPPGTEIKWGQRGGGNVKYGPANDEIQRLIASAYEATAHGGSQEDVRVALQDAISAYVRAGRSPDDAAKAVTTALAAKEPVRVLTGREMTPEEERKWVSRMTTSQKEDYQKAQAAWGLLGQATGKDLNMVSASTGGGGGGDGRIAGMPSALPTGPALSSGRLRLPRVGVMATAPYRASSGGASVGRMRRPRGTRMRRTRSVLGTRQRSPRITTRRRLGTRRRTGYVRA